MQGCSIPSSVSGKQRPREKAGGRKAKRSDALACDVHAKQPAPVDMARVALCKSGGPVCSGERSLRGNGGRAISPHSVGAQHPPHLAQQTPAPHKQGSCTPPSPAAEHLSWRGDQAGLVCVPQTLSPTLGGHRGSAEVAGCSCWLLSHSPERGCIHPPRGACIPRQAPGTTGTGRIPGTAQCSPRAHLPCPARCRMRPHVPLPRGNPAPTAPPDGCEETNAT